MTNNDQKDIWQQYLTEKTGHQLHNAPPERRGVSCACHDCDYWKEGNLCTASEIQLDFNRDEKGNTICQCITYTKKRQHDQWLSDLGHDPEDPNL